MPDRIPKIKGGACGIAIARAWNVPQGLDLWNEGLTVMEVALVVPLERRREKPKQSSSMTLPASDGGLER